ncbi:MAG: hypothetical protein L0Y72_00960 [Gemmataceae bacterium]|nr:hypothetical protein [Gemmataceae bacterium]MCI0737581.1 hypothetical protein [Gemmataceae bacterium]
MNTTKRRLVVVALSGTVGLLATGLSSYSQEKLAKEATKFQSLVRAGYTRPGNPQDRVTKDGKIIPVVADPEYQGPIIGSTVYFAVFSNPLLEETQGYNLDVAHIVSNFVEGRSMENTVSPELDRKGKYLYLYQIVNDRGLDPPKDGIRPAVEGDIETAEINHFALKLVVDPRYITSWGYFRNVTFSSNVQDKGAGKGGVVGAAEGKPAILPMAFSSDPAVLSSLPNQRFRDLCPAFSLGELLPGLALSPSTTGLDKSSHYQKLRDKAKNKERLANWEDNQYRGAVEAAQEPDYVQVTYRGFQENTEPMLDGRDIGYTVFRIDFKNYNTLKTGGRSVVVGFTSDLPPTDEPIQIKGLLPDTKEKDKMARLFDVNFQDGEALQEVAAQQAQAPTPTATGVAPTPIPNADAGLSTSPPTSLGGGTGGGFGGGTPPAAGAGLGAARAPSLATGSGSGEGQGDAQTNQSQNQDERLNFNATLINFQAQAQAQAQFQSQVNNNNCCCDCNGHMIPEPGAFLLGLLGLPALFFIRRKGDLETPLNFASQEEATAPSEK